MPLPLVWLFPFPAEPASEYRFSARQSGYYCSFQLNPRPNTGLAPDGLAITARSSWSRARIPV